MFFSMSIDFVDREPMKLQAVRYFIAIVETGGFRAAAERIHVSQSAITSALQHLEDELGAPLLVRARTGVTPTRFGRAFLDHARVIDHESRKAREGIAQMRGNWEGRVAFATSPAFGINVMPPVVRTFRERYPTIQLRCVDGLYPGTLEGLRDGHLDFAIGPCDPAHLEPPFVAEPLMPADIAIICRKGHPRSRARSLVELAGCEWAISVGPGAAGAILDATLRELNLPALKVGIDCESFLALPGMIAMSDLVGAIPRTLLAHTLWRQQLVVLPIRERLPAPVIAILRRGDIPLTPAAAELLGWLRHYATAAGDPPTSGRPRSRGASNRQGEPPEAERGDPSSTPLPNTRP